MRRTHLFALVLGATSLVGMTACSGGQAQPEASAERSAPSSGVEAFEGVFFGEGPAANALPGLREGKTSKALVSREQIARELEHAIALMKTEGWSESAIDKAQAALDTYRAGGQPQESGPEQAALARELLVERIAHDDPTFFDRFGLEMQSGDPLRVEAEVSDAEARARTALRALGGERNAGPSPAQVPTFTYYAVYKIAAVYYYYFFDAPEADPSSRLARAQRIEHVTTALAAMQAASE